MFDVVNLELWLYDENWRGGNGWKIMYVLNKKTKTKKTKKTKK
jgi:hypothetical protein